MLSITGQLKSLIPLNSGVSKAGKQWQKAGFVIETTGEYPKSVAFDLLGERVNMAQQIPLGSMITVNFSVESHESNGKWFTSVRAISISPAATMQPAPSPAASFYGQPGGQTMPPAGQPQPPAPGQGWPYQPQ